MIVISVLKRRLREGKSYEDFREAWLPEQGFGFRTRVVTAQSADDNRELITIGFSEMNEAEAEAQLQRIGPQGFQAEVLSRRRRGGSARPGHREHDPAAWRANRPDRAQRRAALGTRVRNRPAEHDRAARAHR